MNTTNDSNPVVYKLPQALSDIMDEVLKNLEIDENKLTKPELK